MPKVRETARLAALCLALVLAYHPASLSAERASMIAEFPQAFLAVATGKLKIELVDSVSDGCWQNPAASKNAVELILRNNGFEIDTSEQSFLTTTVKLYALGFENHSLCAVYVWLGVTVWSVTTLPYAAEEKVITSLLVHEEGTLATGSKADVQGGIKSTFADMAEQMVLEIRRAEEKIFAVRPDLQAIAARYREGGP